MVDKIQPFNKLNGVYYTPSDLADFLAKHVIDGSEDSILDPSYGEGALLLAAEKIGNTLSTPKKFELFGCDIKPVNGLLTHLPLAKLNKIDFFNYSVENKADLILMNPPFVRHHFQDNDLISEYKSNFPELNYLKKSSDLWVYFLSKAVLHLNTSGCIGAILPWSFIQSDYSIQLRAWLANSFSDIRLLALNNTYFKDADQLVILLWLKGYGETAKRIEVGTAKSITDKVCYNKITPNDWGADKVICNNPIFVGGILNKLAGRFNLKKFSDFGNVRIGIVTGANKFFITSSSKAYEAGFTDKNLIPIITTSRQFSSILSDNLQSLPKLISISDSEEATHSAWISLGIASNFHLRAHSLLRKPWYSPKIGEIPDAFFPCRSSKIPYLLLNNNCLQSTNAVHRVYFKNLSEVERKWIQISLLSLYSQLSLEVNSKTYGKDILKIEPSSLLKTLVYKSSDPSINTVHSVIIKLLAAHNYAEAYDLATAFIGSALKIPKKFAEDAQLALDALRASRLQQSL